MTWAKRAVVYRQRVLDALAEIVEQQTRTEGNHGIEGPRPHREWAGAARDAIELLTAAAPGRVKGYPRSYALQILVVEGIGRFPLEMADRDVCAPASETDALRMYRETEIAPGGGLAVRRIVLRRFVQAGGSPPHVARWRSFNWRVVWYGSADDYAMGPAALRPAGK